MSYAKWGIGIVVVALALFALFWAQPTANAGMDAQSGIITVGAIAPLSGNVAVYGEYAREGLAMALEEINAKGGVDGREIVLVYEDDRADPALSATASEKLTSVNGVDAAVYFSGSGATLAGLPVLESKHVPTVVALASNAAIRDSGDYVFRIMASDASQGTQWARLVKEGKYTRPAVLRVQNPWSIGITQTFLEQYGSKVHVEEMEEEATDVKTQLFKIKAHDPDVLLLACYVTECITATRQMEEIGLDVPVIAADVYHNQNVLDAVGDIAEGFLITHPRDGTGEQWDAFREKFKERHAKEPTIYHAMAYDALYTLYYAMQEGGTQPEALKDALYQVDFTGPSGHNAFDEYGEVAKDFAVSRVENRSFVSAD